MYRSLKTFTYPLLIGAALATPLASQQRSSKNVSIDAGVIWNDPNTQQAMLKTVDGRVLVMGSPEEKAYEKEYLEPALAAAVAAAGGADTDADSSANLGESVTLPQGWIARGDQTLSGDLSRIRFDTAGSGYRLRLAVDAIVYQMKDAVPGPFRATATFTQTKAAFGPRGYGLFYGGTGLAGAPSYVYFLITGDGKYMVKRRAGSSSADIVPATAHSAVKAVSEQAPAVNVLEIDAKSDPKKIAFIVNGQVVHIMDVAAADLQGIVGLRAGSPLDLQVDGYAVTQ